MAGTRVEQQEPELRVVGVPIDGDTVCAFVAVGAKVGIALNARLAGTEAWSQAVAHVERHLALGHRVRVCGPTCPI